MSTTKEDKGKGQTNHDAKKTNVLPQKIICYKVKRTKRGKQDKLNSNNDKNKKTETASNNRKNNSRNIRVSSNSSDSSHCPSYSSGDSNGAFILFEKKKKDSKMKSTYP